MFWLSLKDRMEYYKETMHILENIRYLKEESRVTGKMIENELGLRPKSINNYLCGDCRPRLDILTKIAEYFGIESVNDLSFDPEKFRKIYTFES